MSSACLIVKKEKLGQKGVCWGINLSRKDLLTMYKMNESKWPRRLADSLLGYSLLSRVIFKKAVAQLIAVLITNTLNLGPHLLKVFFLLF